MQRRPAAVEVTRKPLFMGEALQIGTVEMRPSSDACGDIEWQSSNVVVLPLSGLFSKHDGPNRHVLGTPSHAVFVAAEMPYRIGFPGAIGDRALALRFEETLAPERLDRRGEGVDLAPHGLLSAEAMMLRNLLRLRLERGDAEELEIEALGLELLDAALESMRIGRAPRRRSVHLRRARAVARVKQAVALAPSERWRLAELADVACLSPFHLCRVFREIVGCSIYDYVLQERLAHALEAVLDGGEDLTGIALEAGFASHSHFTARFRRFFGCTPAALRRAATAGGIAELRRIMTARRSHPPLE